MKKTAIFAALSVLLTGSVGACASDRLEQALEVTTSQPLELEQEEEEESAAVAKPKVFKWVCKGCTEIEQKVLDALQERGIKDKIALSVLMGNIKHESQFKPTICEGGKLTGYRGCHRGGFGLIQWTTVGRYDGLGRTAAAYRLDPNSLDAQLKWLFAEREWKLVEASFKNEGQSFKYYMNAAYRWLGWGIYGSRGHYANQYAHYMHWEPVAEDPSEVNK